MDHSKLLKTENHKTNLLLFIFPFVAALHVTVQLIPKTQHKERQKGKVQHKERQKGKLVLVPVLLKYLILEQTSCFVHRYAAGCQR